MPWSNNNLAHVYTNAAFVALDEYGATGFASAGKKKVSSLKTYPGPSAGPNIRKAWAKKTATLLHGAMMTWVGGTKYERGFGATKAIGKMASSLEAGSNTVENVADALDAAFFFAGEFHADRGR